MMNKRPVKTAYWIPPALIPVFVAVDQLTKAWAVSRLAEGPDIILIKGVLRFQYLENSGAAFGILANSRMLFLLFTVALVLVGSAFYLVYARKGAVSPFIAVLFSMVVAGAIGNFIDRALSGAVTDFIYFELIDFPIFNVADIYITCACFAAVIWVFRSAGNEKRDLSR